VGVNLQDLLMLVMCDVEEREARGLTAECACCQVGREVAEALCAAGRGVAEDMMAQLLVEMLYRCRPVEPATGDADEDAVCAGCVH